MNVAEGFHFAQPLWLWAILAPLALWWWPRARRVKTDWERMERYADRHLLPYLIRGQLWDSASRRPLLLWTLLWCLGILAMAGPRLGYTDVSVYAPGTNLVILMDLSRSMEAADVKPSRLARARQEIEDLLDRNPGIRVGLIAFASVSHVVAPITEDDETLRHLLPSLSTDLVRWQGSRLGSALERAQRLLSGQPKEGQHTLLLISDGDFSEQGLMEQVRALHDLGIRLHVLGVGTPEGAPVPDKKGAWIRGRDGNQVISRLDEAGLRSLAQVGGGIYRRADYRDDDTLALLEQVAADAQPDARQKGTHRIWNERFYLLILVMMAILLNWFRHTRVVRG